MRVSPGLISNLCNFSAQHLHVFRVIPTNVERLFPHKTLTLSGLSNGNTGFFVRYIHIL